MTPEEWQTAVHFARREFDEARKRYEEAKKTYQDAETAFDQAKNSYNKAGIALTRMAQNPEVTL
jgi:hypothetical protein